MSAKKVLFLAMVISTSVLLTSCGSTITQADLDAAYQQGYNDGQITSYETNTQNQVMEDNTSDNTEAGEAVDLEESNSAQQPSNTDNSSSSTDQIPQDTQNTDQIDEATTQLPDIVSIITTMQASAPVIDTKNITVYYDDYASDLVFASGEHIGEYNGIQVDDMFNLYSDAYNEKYYVVTDDLKNVENTLHNAYEKSWLELGYTNCIPAIRYDSDRKIYEENPYDMVHPGWQHTYAVMYSCTWSDGTPKYGIYYISVYNDTDQEVMAILCPITSINDGMSFIC